MSWKVPFDFAEGDSGVISTPNIKIWQDIEAGKKKKAVTWVECSGSELFGRIIGIGLAIAENAELKPCDRIAAIDVVRQAIMDYSTFGPGKSESDENDRLAVP